MSASGYRPICDKWLLARTKYRDGKKRYGGYPAGFLVRARDLLGVAPDDPVLHVCGGLARYYPFEGFGPNDKTLDLDPLVEPDFLQDCTAPLPGGFRAMIADPPYSEEDADRYPGGRAVYPSPGAVLANMLRALPIGHKAGILHYGLPRPPATARFVASVTIIVGFGNRTRDFSVFARRT